MAPSNALIGNQLRQLVYYHLDNDLLDNALFVAGRLHALEPRNADAAHLMSLCYLRLGHYGAAYDCSRNIASRGSHLGCMYVFAKACYALKRYMDGASALERGRGQWEASNNWNHFALTDQHSEFSRRHSPDAPAVWTLLGKLWNAIGDIRRSVECHSEALRLNPFMWDAYKSLCDNGANPKPEDVFRMHPGMASSSYDPKMANLAAEETTLPHLEAQGQFNSGKATVATPNNNTCKPVVRGDGFGSLGAPLQSCILNNAPGVRVNPGLQTNEVAARTSNAPDTDVVMGEVTAPLALSGYSGDPPDAPLRKARTQRTLGFNLDFEVPRFRQQQSKSELRADVQALEVRRTGLGVGETIENPHEEAGEVIREDHAISNHRRLATSNHPEGRSSTTVDESAAPQRRSVRLFNQIRPASNRPVSGLTTISSRDGRELKKAKAAGARGRTASTSTVGRVVSGNRKPMDHGETKSKESRAPSVASTLSAAVSQKHSAMPSGSSTQTSAAAPATAESGRGRNQETLQWILHLFRALGNGYLALSQYRSQAALKYFDSIPSSQKETVWVIAQMGKAHYEQSSYREAERYFSRLRKIAPSRTDDMEIYSTVLWHNQSEIKLAHLAHDLMQVDRLSPQAWCALGNSFSLQRHHDQAVKCFKRATQLDPSFAYAYTLQGHELVANEEYDKAVQAYRAAISADQRHYNAWYGLGKVYEKLLKYEYAEEHYRAAARINATNAVLVVCIGQVLEKQDRLKAALIQYSNACDLDPRSALSRFKKAKVLMNLKYHEEALVELLVLKDIAPDEANVHFNLGRLYGMMGEKANAIRHFTIALNLDPKAGQYIKESMEALHEPANVGYGDDAMA